MDYATDENVETGYWGAFLGPVLTSLGGGVSDGEKVASPLNLLAY
jgi:hypothetical protein